jgi:hypothetical protein
MGDMICPECMGALAPADGKSARCTVHGGTYKVLYWRGMPAGASTGAPAPTHVPVPGRSPDSAAADPAARSPAILPNQMPATPAAGEASVAMCSTHREVPAIARCNTCGQPICQTCDFAFPMSVGQPSGVLGLGTAPQVALHLCPRCASAPRPKVQGSRKKYLMWSYGLAVWSTLALLALFVLAPNMQTRDDLETMSTIVGNLIIWPSLVGTALGVSSIDRRLANPFSIKVPAIWNGVILGVFILLMIIGLTK